MLKNRTDSGYVLIATIILGLALSIISTLFMQYIASSSATLNNQTYTALAAEAAEAGIVYASTCIGQTETEWSMLKPNVTCDGNTTSALAPSYFAKSNGGIGPAWISTFEVPDRNDTANFTETYRTYTLIATGKVSLYSGSILLKTYTVKKTVSIDKIYGQAAVSDPTRPPITDLSIDSHSCAIANGRVYCWGPDNKGQLGDYATDNSSNPKNIPTLVSAALDSGGNYFNFATRMSTKVAVGTENTCAINDGQLYCWGDNAYGQLGVGVTGSSVPYPLPVGGLLAGKKVTDVSLSQGTSGPKSACAIADGTIYCWGANNTQQLGTSTASTVDTTIRNTPTRVYGYNSGDTGALLFGKKSSSVSVGESSACAVTEGKVSCWGGQAYAAAPPTSYSGYGEYYNYPSYIAQGGIKVTSQASCSLSVIYYYEVPLCHGQSRTLKKLNSTDPIDQYPSFTRIGAVTAQDGGGSYSSGEEMYCVIDYGMPFCQGTSNTGTAPLALSLGTPEPASKSVATFAPLRAHDLNDGDPDTSTDYYSITTHIGTGNKYGCLVANGKLWCWGTDTNGTLANSGSASYYDRPTRVADSTIGTSYGGFDAEGPVSGGTNHSCTVANSIAFCWGLNSSGQLGIANTTNKDQPTAPVIIINYGTQKLSAGGDHTCSISGIVHVFCWGANTNGELGLGTTSQEIKPTEITSFFNNQQLPTDISSGPTNTCVVAAAQVYCWGKNDDKQVGTNASGDQKTPVLVAGLSGKIVTAVSVGTTHACAIANGDIYCWGSNDNGELGQTPSAIDQYTATKITTGAIAAGTGSGSVSTATATAITAGNHYTCAIINGGAACWGKNDQGQTGNSAAVSSPTYISGLNGLQATSISAGDIHACAVAQGKTYCWGNQTDGRLGDGASSNTVRTATNRMSLVNGNGEMATDASSSSVGAGSSSTCTTANGIIYCFGNGSYSKLGNMSSVNQASPVATKFYQYIVTSNKGPTF